MKHYAMLSDSVFNRATTQTTVERRRPNRRQMKAVWGMLRQKRQARAKTLKRKNPWKTKGLADLGSLPYACKCHHQ